MPVATISCGDKRADDGRCGIYAYEARLLHAKAMVIDGAWATIGSTNLDLRSDLAASRRVTRDAWEERPVTLRLLELDGS